MVNKKAMKMFSWVLLLVLALSCMSLSSYAEAPDAGDVGGAGAPTETEGELPGDVTGPEEEPTPEEPTPEQPPVEPDPDPVEPPKDPVDPPKEETPPADPSTEPEPENNVPDEEEEAADVSVTFAADAEVRVVLVKQGQPVERPATNPAKDGFVFVHWYADGTAQDVAYDFSSPVEADLTLIALFEEAEEEEGFVPGEEAETEGDLGLDETIVEDETTPEEGEEVSTLPEGASVAITSDAGDLVQYGDTITLTAVITGLDETEYTVAWRYDDGTGWQALSSGTATTHSFVLDEQNISWLWEVEITVQ